MTAINIFFNTKTKNIIIPLYRMCDFHKHAITTYKVITCNRVISDCIYNIIQLSLCFYSDIKAHHHKFVSTAI